MAVARHGAHGAVLARRILVVHAGLAHGQGVLQGLPAGFGEKIRGVFKG